MDAILNELADVAAMYWGDFLRQRSPPDNEAGDPSLNLTLDVVGGLRRGRSNITKEQAARFEDHLRASLLEELEDRAPTWVAPSVTFGVDYDPPRILLEALAAAGVPYQVGPFSAAGLFPCKTYMRVSVATREVLVKTGYGAQYEQVWYIR